MFTLLGSVVVLLCVGGSLLMEGGGLLLLWHPSEIIIIVGAAFGGFVTSNPFKVVKGSFAAALGLIKGPRCKREDYVDLLKLLYDILVKIRKSGMLAIEADIEAPEKSKMFTDYPRILADHHMIEFITDCLRLIVGGKLDPHELESLLECELETHHQEAAEPAHAVQRVADALPGFGIVAAVLGIVDTMAAIEHRVHEEGKAFEVVKMAPVASVRGYAPPVAVEFARKLLWSDVRPSFADLENHLKGKKKEPQKEGVPA